MADSGRGNEEFTSADNFAHPNRNGDPGAPIASRERRLCVSWDRAHRTLHRTQETLAQALGACRNHRPSPSRPPTEPGELHGKHGCQRRNNQERPQSQGYKDNTQRLCPDGQACRTRSATKGARPNGRTR